MYNESRLLLGGGIFDTLGQEGTTQGIGDIVNAVPGATGQTTITSNVAVSGQPALSTPGINPNAGQNFGQIFNTAQQGSQAQTFGL